MRITIRQLVLLCLLAQASGESLQTIFSGAYHADGNIFEVVAKGNQVSIERLDVNMDAGTGTVEVWSRPGNIVLNNFDEGWILIKSFEVTGQGQGQVTSLPAFTSPVVVPAGSTQSFYVSTLTDDVDLWYGVGTQTGSALASDANLDILEGYVLGYPFRGGTSPRTWNGAIHYSVGGAPAQPTKSPTKLPTKSPSPKPTSLPTALPTAPPSPKPTSYPTLLPTLSPTKKSTPSPTTKTTTNPTRSPTAPTAPTNNELTLTPSYAPTLTRNSTMSPTSKVVQLLPSNSATGDRTPRPIIITSLIVLSMASAFCLL